MVNHPRRPRKTTAAVLECERPADEHAFAWAGFMGAVQDAFGARGERGIFETDAGGLYDIYLGRLPAERNIHTCSACRRFINGFGGLVTIGEAGEARSLMWGRDVPEFYRPAVDAMRHAVESARVTGPFLAKEPTWGLPVTGAWTHLAVRGAPAFRERTLTARQAMAAKREDFRTVAQALADCTAPMLDEAMRLLKAEALHLSERFIAPAAWLRALHDRPKGRRGENVLWAAVAAAPAGYCHPRASVVGSLLEDIAAGMAFDDIRARFNAKVAPLAYQRPQAAPTAGNIKAAEAIVEKLGLASALERRFARLDEVVHAAIWTPKVERAPIGGGVFGHLKPKDERGAVRQIDLPPQATTWVKFRDTVLPSTEAMEFMVPLSGHFIALTTAVHADAPPLLKWDHEDARNPVAWYVYPGGSLASAWGLAPTWTRVNAVVPLPTMWGARPAPFLGDGMVLVLDGAMDVRTGHGAGLFPSALKDDLHQVRSTIEAYSRGAELSGRDVVGACGWDLRHQQGACVAGVRCLSAGRWTAYGIDRWD